MRKPFLYFVLLAVAVFGIAIQNPTKGQAWFAGMGYFVGWWAQELLAWFFPPYRYDGNVPKE